MPGLSLKLLEMYAILVFCIYSTCYIMTPCIQVVLRAHYVMSECGQCRINNSTIK